MRRARALVRLGAGPARRRARLPAHAAPAAPPAPAAGAPVAAGAPDPRLLDEMEKDVQRFAQMVTEYRSHRARRS